jgi:hypothetical protein
LAREARVFASLLFAAAKRVRMFSLGISMFLDALHVRDAQSRISF